MVLWLSRKRKHVILPPSHFSLLDLVMDVCFIIIRIWTHEPEPPLWSLLVCDSSIMKSLDMLLKWFDFEVLSNGCCFNPSDEHRVCRQACKLCHSQLLHMHAQAKATVMHKEQKCVEANLRKIEGIYVNNCMAIQLKTVSCLYPE